MRVVKKAQTVKKKYKVKARKIKSFGTRLCERRPGSFPKESLLLKEIVEENLETFKLLARY